MNKEYDRAIKKSLTENWGTLSMIVPLEWRDKNKGTPPIKWAVYDNEDGDLYKIRFPISKVTTHLWVPYEGSESKEIRYATYRRTEDIINEIDRVYSIVEERSVSISIQDIPDLITTICKPSYAFPDSSSTYKGQGLPLMTKGLMDDQHNALYMDLITEAYIVKELDTVERTLYRGGYRWKEDTSFMYPMSDKTNLVKVVTDTGLSREVIFHDDPKYLLGRIYVENKDGKYNLFTPSTVRIAVWMENNTYVQMKNHSDKIKHF